MIRGKQIYKKPPITERVVGVYTSIKPEDFEAKMPSWAEKIQNDYPLARPIAEWTLDIKEIKGIPTFADSTPRAEIIQLFWKPHPKKLPVFGMRLRPDRLVLHLESEKDKPHDFEEVYKEMEIWLPKWMDHFGVSTLKGVTVEYVNRLNAVVTPQFMTPDGGIKISEAFVLFANIPGKFVGITKPYDCKLRLVVDPKLPCYIDVRVRAEDEAREGVRIDFTAITLAVNKAISAVEALAEIRVAHDVILEQFDCLFTESAKQSFEIHAISDTAK